MSTGLSGDALSGDCWQRWFSFTLTADLDRRTLDCVIVKLQDGVASTGEEIYSASGVPFLNDVADIGSFALMGYGMKDSAREGFMHSVVYDSVEVWRDVGTAGERRIYMNDFARRERVVAPPQPDDSLGDMAGLQGTDGWWARGGSFKVHSLDGNAFASAEAARGTTGVVARALGLAAKAASVTVSADMRPPSKWQWLLARDASVAVGGDTFLRGQFDGSDFLGKAAMRFGFDSGGDEAGSYGTSQSSAVRVYASDAGGKRAAGVTVDPSHWYRFVATANVPGRTWSLQVFDMGLAQPELSGAAASQVAGIGPLAFSPGADEAVTAVAISAAGLEGDAPWLGGLDPGRVLIDNLTVDVAPAGTKIILR